MKRIILCTLAIASVTCQHEDVCKSIEIWTNSNKSCRLLNKRLIVIKWCTGERNQDDGVRVNLEELWLKNHIDRQALHPWWKLACPINLFDFKGGTARQAGFDH